MIGRALFALTLFTFTILAACIPMWPIYESPQLLILIAGTVLVGNLIALLGAWRKLSALTMIVLGLLSFCILALPLADPARLQSLSPASAQSFVAAIWESWRKILTMSLPLGTTDGLLIAPLILLLVTSIAGYSIVLRARKQEFAAVFPVVVFLWGILWGPFATPSAILGGLGIVATVTVFVSFVRVSRSRRQIRRTFSAIARRGVAAVVAGTIALTIGGLAAQSIPLGERFVLRTEPALPTFATEQQSPLSLYRSWLQPDVADAVQFRVSGLPDGARVRLVTLDSYDGEVFGVSSAHEFVRVPRQFGSTMSLGDAVQLGISINEYSGSWVPSLGDGTGLSFVGNNRFVLQESLYVNSSTGSIAVARGLQQGDTYEYTGVLPTPTETLSELTPYNAAPDDVSLPQEAAAKLAEWVAGAESPGERLSAIVQGFMTEGYISHGIELGGVESRPGHSLMRIEELFTGTMIGDAEQYATAAALLFNEVGFSARVVLGFAPSVGESDLVDVTGADISAWVEVQTTQGWQAINVTPAPRPIPEEEDDPTQPGTQLGPPSQPNLPEGGTEVEIGNNNPLPDAPLSRDTDQTLVIVLRSIGFSLLGLVVLASPILAIVLSKAFRRQRRWRANTREDRVSGSWDEYLDAVIDSGGPRQGTQTRIEFAGDNAEAVQLARIVDGAIFGSGQPRSRAIQEAWVRSDRLVAEIRAGQRRIDRVRSKLSLRSWQRDRESMKR
ncbi:transglutaminaseTgpA domain-containing protein [Humidisolicoccus flavus]|uniref:transglutaminase family protein n=1 Tax=Humidisolicoccus flavus TaxID=3111414 RepID=UPI0032513C97